MIVSYDPHGVNGRLRDSAGFTVLEIIIAISLLTVGILAVASLQVSSIKGISFSKQVTESSDRVQDRIEKLLLLNYFDQSLTDRTGDGINGLNNIGTVLADHYDDADPQYMMYWNVVEDWAGGNSMVGVKTIRVVVVWQDHGTQKRHSFDLLKTEL